MTFNEAEPLLLKTSNIRRAALLRSEQQALKIDFYPIAM
jgi:hypothetical protein